MSYFPQDGDSEDGDDAMDVEQQRLIHGYDMDVNDGRTSLDKTIDRIGMGTYDVFTSKMVCSPSHVPWVY